MQNDDTTIFEISEEADDVMQQLAAVGLHGMSNKQADLVVQMGRLLDNAARTLDRMAKAAGRNPGDLVQKAAHHALMMRTQGAVLRGAKGAGLIEDLCDAVLAAAKPKVEEKPVVVAAPVRVVESVVKVIRLPESGTISVDYAAECLGCDVGGIADMLEIQAETVRRWKRNGFIPWQASQKLADISRAAA